MTPLARCPSVLRGSDTCNVYGVVYEGVADLVDFGAGTTLPGLPGQGADRVGGVLLTHHHRDQLQGLAGVRGKWRPDRIWVPETEAHLIGPGLERHLVGREVHTNYNTREDRFSSLVPVGYTDLLRDHRSVPFGAGTLTVVPTPGHTTGGVSLVGHVDELRVAFVGDLLSGPGKVTSLAATEWSYGGGEGLIATVASLMLLRRLDLDLLLPSHGEPIEEPAAAIDLVVDRMLRLLELRDDPPALWTQRPTVAPTVRHGTVHELRIETDGAGLGSPHLLREFCARPYERISDHLLINRTASGNTHVLLSESGNALFFDFGYDMFVWGDPAGFDRAKVRTWLYTLDALKRDFGVERVEVALPTHYHDDHVASLGILQEVEGTELWVPRLMAGPLARPADFDLPCTWFDPIVADRILADDGPVTWHEHTIDVFPLPGHTLYAAAYGFEVDGMRVLNVGDQYRTDRHGDLLTAAYIYKNGFRRYDYADTAARISDYRPDLLLSGHWAPYYPRPSYFDELVRKGRELERLHDELLDADRAEANVAFFVRIIPFTQVVATGRPVRVGVEVTNPETEPVVVSLRLCGDRHAWWPAAAAERELAGGETALVPFELPPPPSERAGTLVRVAVDVTFGGRHLGQVADGMLDVGT